MNKHNKTEAVIGAENKVMVAKRERCRGGEKQVSEVKRYNIPVMK